MAKQAQKFRQIADRYLEKLKESANDAKKTLAKQATRKVIDYSPVRTGAYVTSHRIGIDQIDPSHEPFITVGPGEEIPPKMPTALAAALKESLYAKHSTEISRAPFDKDIYVSNSIPYANQVEYIGWRLTEARHVYHKANLDLKAVAPIVVKAAMRRTKK